MPKQPAYANLLTEGCEVVHVTDRLDQAKADYGDFLIRREDWWRDRAGPEPYWNTVVATDAQHNWQCVSGKSVAVHIPIEPDVAFGFLQQGAKAVFFLDPRGALTEAMCDD